MKNSRAEEITIITNLFKSVPLQSAPAVVAEIKKKLKVVIDIEDIPGSLKNLYFTTIIKIKRYVKKVCPKRRASTHEGKNMGDVINTLRLYRLDSMAIAVIENDYNIIIDPEDLENSLKNVSYSILIEIRRYIVQNCESQADMMSDVFSYND